MKNKIIYSTCLIICSALFFVFGWYVHKTPEKTLADDHTNYGPLFDYYEPYLPLAMDACPPDNTSDWYVCLNKLADKTESDSVELTNKLSKTSDEMKNKIQTVEESRSSFTTSFCVLDSMMVQGGSGTDLEYEACRYNFAKNYIELLKSLGNPASVRSN